ncbi:hypothetical protein EVAR_42577_1 [Eumeta japonica]|uniref:Uncharacterized protein n=1 Tax=Eumeta variegata TaxID=151549 RepID=A0A4C1ZTN0_EUMVA|nr:hypothetical protein EVAR_42577_1 [Eumeta japonica]
MLGYNAYSAVVREILMDTNITITKLRYDRASPETWGSDRDWKAADAEYMEQSEPHSSKYSDESPILSYRYMLCTGCGWESLMKSVTLGNVTMSHRTREARRICASLPLNYDRSAARALEN